MIQALASRHTMQDDGINYLDMGDALVRRDWNMALNGIWSPLYPFLQGLARKLFNPSSYSQFTLVHFVNFLIFLFALGCFEFLLQATVADRPRSGDAASEISPLPRWAVFAVGYSVFLWAFLRSVTVQRVTPDILTAGFLFLAVGLLLQIWTRPQDYWRFVLLGAVLGLGYLAKSPFFPLAFVFFLLAWILTGDWRKAAPRVLSAVLVFLAVAAPWFLALSQAKGRLMFSDTARFNYVQHVNGAGPNWYFQDLGTAAGHFVHPVRKIFDAPPVYEFATPVKGTLPVAYDPSYWSEGAVPRVSLRQQLSVIHLWLAYYFDILLSSQKTLLVGLIVLCIGGGRGLLLQQGRARWPVWLIGLVGLGMYTLVHAELRYVAAFFALFWVGLFSGVKVPSGRGHRRLVALVTVVVVVVMAKSTAIGLVGQLKQALKVLPNNQWQVAEDLQKLGVKPGDRVARLPAHYGLAWARLLPVTDVAEVPLENSADFWCAKPETRAQAIAAIRGLGVTAFVAEQTVEACAPGPEWHKLGDGTYYALRLAPSGIQATQP